MCSGAEPLDGTIVQCARCGEHVWAEDMYLCDQCGEYVCADCLAVVGSDNNESQCRDCPAMQQASVAIKVDDGTGQTHDVSLRDMFPEQLADEDDAEQARRERIADGEPTAEDVEHVAGQAEEQGEDR